MVDNIPADIITAGERNFTFKVENKADGQGYFAYEGRESKNALLCLQEWWGLNKSICETSELLAKQGFAVLAVDLYRGQVADDRESAGHLFDGLDYEGGVTDILAAAKALKE